MRAVTVRRFASRATLALSLVAGATEASAQDQIPGVSLGLVYSSSYVPALAMKVGYDENTPEAKIAADWTRERYHAPSDDLTQPIDRAAAVGFTDLIARLSVRVANRNRAPAWKADSFFRRFARRTAGMETGQ